MPARATDVEAPPADGIDFRREVPPTAADIDPHRQLEALGDSFG